MIDTSLTLPRNDVFESPHSTDWHHDIADRATALLTQVGSGLHGVTITDQDDRDEMGVCMEPPEIALGHKPFKMYEFRTQPRYHRSGPGDLDLNVYGFRKFTALLAAGNPTKLLPLFAPDHDIVRMNWVGEMMRNDRGMFLSQESGGRFLGYLGRQMNRFRGSLSQRTNRPELVAVHGYDTKFAYHAIRVGLQGIQLMNTGEIQLPMIDSHRNYLLSVRRGEMTVGQVDVELERVHGKLVRAIGDTSLPERVDMDLVSRWCANAYRDYWAGQRL